MQATSSPSSSAPTGGGTPARTVSAGPSSSSAVSGWLRSSCWGIALILFAVVPLGPATLDNGFIGIYLLGAFGSIIAGNTLAIIYGTLTKTLGTPRWVRITSIILGILGLINIAATYGWAPIGVAERISVYSYLTWALLAGATLLITRRHTSALPAGTKA